MPIAAATRAGRAEPPTRANDQFVAMLNAYRSSGGLARGGEVLSLFGRRGAPDLALLARRIAQRQVIAFDWQLESWLPWFQFSHRDLGTHPALEEVLMELNPLHSPWGLAGWFVQRHESLGQRTPVEVFASDPAAVRQAARSDRAGRPGASLPLVAASSGSGLGLVREAELLGRESPGHA